MKRKILFPVFCWIFFLGCASSIKYTGKSFPASSNIEVFYNEKDIKKPYDSIGTIEGSMKTSADFNEVMEKIKKEARLHGADGVVISGIQLIGNKSDDSSKRKESNELVNQNLVGTYSKISYEDRPNNQSMNIMKFQCIKYK